jgi:hypothetical protein
VLGLCAGTGGKGAKFWMSVLTDIRNRETRDVFFVVCDGLKGLPEVVGNVWPLTTVQSCIVHLIRSTSRMASKRDSDALPRTSNRSTPRERTSGPGGPRGPGRAVRREVPGDYPVVAQRLGGVHPVPGLRTQSDTRSVVGTWSHR